MGEVELRRLESARVERLTEQVVLENNALRVTILPALGGKIASIQILRDREELLQQPLRPYAPRIRYMSFDTSDASGWDECLPSVAACEMQTAAHTVLIPDHGDFWQVEWHTLSQTKTDVTLSADGFSLPLRFSKTLQLLGNRLHVSYELLNRSAEPVEYVWSAHPLFAVEPGDRILLPDSVSEVTVEGSARNRLGKQGSKVAWPKAVLENSNALDLSVAGNVTDRIGDKLFAASPKEGWCAIVRHRLRCRVELRYNAGQLPFLGLWICYGGWPESGVNRQQCVALEPCNAAGDSLAIAAAEGRARRLVPNVEDRWSLELHAGGVS
jgi:galactose mutarotase-like enzyme